MVLIEKPPGLHFRTVDAIVALDFQPHPLCIHHDLQLSNEVEYHQKYSNNVVHSQNDARPTESNQHDWNQVERLAAGAGSCVHIWALNLKKWNQSHDIHPQHYFPYSKLNDVSSPLKQSISDTMSSDIPNGMTKDIPEDVLCSHKESSYPSCKIASRCVYVIKDHSPHYIVSVRWSPTGLLLASCDHRTIILSEFARFTDIETSKGEHLTSDRLLFSNEIWRTVHKMSDTQSDIFDLCWLGDDQLLTGTINGIKVWNICDQGISHYVKYSNGFVTGLCSYSRRYIGAQSNDKRILLWAKTKNIINDSQLLQTTVKQSAVDCFNGFSKMIDDTDLIQLGPSDLPYYRRGSFDPVGKFVAFPYGERGSQCFGVTFALDSNNTDNPVPPFRFRGHLARVNCVSFSRGVWSGGSSCIQNIKTSKMKKHIKSSPLSDTKFTLYAQASLDGALSIWKMMYSLCGSVSCKELHEHEDGLPRTAECLLILKPKFLDEQASVTDMTWIPEGNMLAIGADDGSITIVAFHHYELQGWYLNNTKQWAKVTRLPIPPRPPRVVESPTSIEQQSLLPNETHAHVIPQSSTPIIEGSSNAIPGPRNNKSQARRRIAPTLISNVVALDS